MINDYYYYYYLLIFYFYIYCFTISGNDQSILFILDAREMSGFRFLHITINCFKYTYYIDAKLEFVLRENMKANY